MARSTPYTDTYYVNDQLATTLATIDARGIIDQIETDAFGAPLPEGRPAVRYTGKPWDDDMGAYIFPYRNYRPDEARWMTPDPSGFPDGRNNDSYAPVPTKGFDRLGLNWGYSVESGTWYWFGNDTTYNPTGLTFASESFDDPSFTGTTSWNTSGGTGTIVQEVQFYESWSSSAVFDYLEAWTSGPFYDTFSPVDADTIGIYGVAEWYDGSLDDFSTYNNTYAVSPWLGLPYYVISDTYDYGYASNGRPDWWDGGSVLHSLTLGTENPE